MNEMEKKTYREILIELESYKLLHKISMIISTIEILFIYSLIRLRYYFDLSLINEMTMNIIIFSFMFLVMIQFLMPLFIEILIKKVNKHISY